MPDTMRWQKADRYLANEIGGGMHDTIIGLSVILHFGTVLFWATCTYTEKRHVHPLVRIHVAWKKQRNNSNHPAAFSQVKHNDTAVLLLYSIV